MSEQSQSVLNNLVNAILFQLSWFSLVLGFYNGLLGFLFVLLMLLHRLLICTQPIREMSLVCLVCVLGITSDALLFKFQVYQTVTGEDFVLVPIWLMGLWLAFSLTLFGSLKWLVDHGIWFVGLVSVVGPFSYVAGASLGALQVSSEYVYWMIIQWCLLGLVITWFLKRIQKYLKV